MHLRLFLGALGAQWRLAKGRLHCAPVAQPRWLHRCGSSGGTNRIGTAARIPRTRTGRLDKPRH
jgi:hypothetical protein